MVDRVVLGMNRLAGNLADALVAYTNDYATHSPFLSRYVGKKLQVIPPPVELADCTAEEEKEFRDKHQLEGRKVIGISARLATEKGVEVLLKALPQVLAAYPSAQVLHAGMHEGVIGEEAYAQRLAPLFKKYQDNYKLLGNLEGAEYSAFHSSLDCLVMSSLNSTESFGLVQIEAMMNGTPVAACNLPGVRQPVTMTGMGEVTEIGDHDALAKAIIKLLDDKEAYVRSPEIIGDSFSPDSTAAAYVELFSKLQQDRMQPGIGEPAAYQRLRAMRDAFKK